MQHKLRKQDKQPTDSCVFMQETLPANINSNHMKLLHAICRYCHTIPSTWEDLKLIPLSAGKLNAQTAKHDGLWWQKNISVYPLVDIFKSHCGVRVWRCSSFFVNNLMILLSLSEVGASRLCISVGNDGVNNDARCISVRAPSPTPTHRWMFSNRQLSLPKKSNHRFQLVSSII